MKKIIRKTAVLLSLILIVSLMAGCVNSTGDADSSTPGNNPGSPGNTGNIPGDGIGLPEVVYLSEVIPFPELPYGMTNISNVVLADGSVYFSAWGIGNSHMEIDADGNVTVSDDTSGLFSMDADGTNFMELPNYIPGAGFTEEKNVSVIIDNLHADSEGNLWVIESVTQTEYNLPDNYTADDLASINDYINYKNIVIIRKLDKTGTELESFDISNVDTSSDWFYVLAFCVDDSGNIYIASGSNIYVLDDRGGLLYSLENPDYTAQFVRLSDGTAAFVNRQGWDRYLQKFDLERRSWGEVLSLPSDVQGVQAIFSGIGEYLYLFNDSMFLNGIVAETGEHVKILNWNDSAVSPGDVKNIMFLPDEEIAVLTQPPRTTIGVEPAMELVLLTAASYDELPERIILTYGISYYDSDRRYAVELFNRTSTTHRIQVIDYSQFNTTETANAGFLRLTTEIISGNCPDILDIYDIPMSAVSKGFFTDLYPYIDADPGLNRSDFIESVLVASETEGFLYRIAPAFSIRTIYGHPSVLGSYPGWTMDEFIAVLEANPQADVPIGPWFNTNINFLSIGTMVNMDDYVNWTSGTVDFDNDDFIKLLEFANGFPSEVEWDNSVPLTDLYAAGRYIMFTGFGTPEYLHGDYTLLGGEIVFKGYPTESRDGHSFSSGTNIAISSSCTDKEAAWEFVRIFLTEEYQRDFFSRSLPVNRVVFEERLVKAMEPPGSWLLLVDGNTLDVRGLSPDVTDMIRDIVDNTTRMSSFDSTLWNIVSETASDYFNGRITVQDAARIIQSRASIYIAEQS